jgi:peptide/nickel transport system ATP-binding protein
MSNPTPLLSARTLRRFFPLKSRGEDGQLEQVRAVDGISLDVFPGETLAIVGESGCGKSTIARMMVKLIEPDEGDILLAGERVDPHQKRSMRAFRQAVQMVFQDSYSSLNPRMTLEQAVSFGMRVNGVPAREAHERSHAMLARVGLNPHNFAQRYPHELSGGQRQRVNIARALVMEPKVVILDEAVSALDKSVEAQVLNLLQDLQRDLGLTYIFITHDLNVVQHIADRVAVMYLGRVAEMGTVEQVFQNPLHPYTQGLLQSRLSMNPHERLSSAPLSGDPPNPINPPSGCSFRTRCPHADTVCAGALPPLSSPAQSDQEVACHARHTGSGHSLPLTH